MGIRKEVLEELEELEHQCMPVKETRNPDKSTPKSDDDDDRDIHGIGWNIHYKKFIEGDIN